MKTNISPIVSYAFKKFFGEAAVTAFENEDISNYSQAELDDYEHRAKPFRDLKNVIDTAKREDYEKGYKEGIKLGIEEATKEYMKKAAIALKDNEAAFDLISKATGLTVEEIEQL